MRHTLSLLVVCVFVLNGFSQTGKGHIYHKAAVVCAHPEAARVGEEVLRRGGNAADAALAVHFALAVVYPSAGNLGGGGFALYRSTQGGYDFLDFRETAPAKASRDMFLDRDKNPEPGKSTGTHAAAGVPGSVAGIWEFHRKYGSLPPEKLMQPAIRLAYEGFAITRMQADEFNHYAQIFKTRNVVLPDLFRPEGWKAGDILRQERLGNTLTRIAKNGPAGFYRGITARMIVAEMKNGNGLISLSDLKKYKPVWRTPIRGQYRGYTVVSAPPPSSGGIALLQMLKLAERYPFAAFGLKSVEDIFYTTEIERLVYADRAKFTGDPDFFDIPADSLLSDAYTAERASLIRPLVPNVSADILPGRFAVKEKEYTTHFSIVDSMGNAVSLTTTINDHYGSKIFVADAGFLLNNEMDDFSIKPGVANMYGLTGAEANAIAPRKRMLSSMTPTIVEKDGKLFMLLGTPGGSTIITTVFRLIVGVIDHRLTMNEAVAVTRFHHQWLPDVISYEAGAFSPEMLEELKNRGYTTVERSSIGRADCLLLRPDQTIEAAPDPRGDDTAAGW